jgi:adenosylcobyric acid synthase
MIQGTSSSVGKSVMAAALCRILAQDGYNVAPFKAQNMSNNSYVTADGGEMGRAQVVQAQAAGVEPTTDMNPVLLKPEADSRSQVVVNGKPVGSFEARKYWGDQTDVWKAVTEAYDRLATEYDVIVLEGAGSPAEVNLRDRDIVNMKMAAYANASVILVGDIDRGGVFASLLGTMELLLPEERALVKATLINRFRGDIALLNPLPEMIAERTGVPVAGVVPFVYDLQVKDEDGVTFGDYDPPGAGLAPSLLREGPREGRLQREPSHPMTSATKTPDGAVTEGVIGTYVHGLFDSPNILRRLLNTVCETHNLPKPIIQEFSMEAEYDRLAQITRDALDMPLIRSLID